MQTFTLTNFMADVQDRARRSGVADLPVDALRNKGGRRSSRKRALLARAGARSRGNDAGIVSYI